MNAENLGVPRRKRFLDRLGVALANTKSRALVGVVVIRIPRMHEININYSYDFVDAMVHEVAKRSAGILRDIDSIERIEEGGFALVLPNLFGSAQAELAAASVLKSCKARFEFLGRDLTIQIAVGVALFPTHASAPETLLRCAELALAQSNENPMGYAVYSASLEGQFKHTRGYALERSLLEAIERDELHLCLQPKLDLRSGRLVGAEALVRWTTASGERVPPDVFIPIAERSTLIVKITLWTLNAALRCCSDYFERYPGFSVAVNLSPMALNDPDIFDFITQTASIWCTDKQQLTLEITEGALIRDPEIAIEILNKFHRENIRLSIDDFGTGYSSFAQLGRLSVDELKIDKSFVMGVIGSERNAVIVRSVIDLAHNFGMTAVAEGIEDQKTLEFLTELGCDCGQGYYLGQPMTLEDFENWTAASCAPTLLAAPTVIPA